MPRRKKSRRGVQSKPFLLCVICGHTVYTDVTGELLKHNKRFGDNITELDCTGPEVHTEVVEMFMNHDERFGDNSTKLDCLNPEVIATHLSPQLALSGISMANAH